jgi:hypothetical protein
VSDSRPPTPDTGNNDSYAPSVTGLTSPREQSCAESLSRDVSRGYPKLHRAAHFYAPATFTKLCVRPSVRVLLWLPLIQKHQHILRCHRPHRLNSPRFWLNSSLPSLSSTAEVGTPFFSGTSDLSAMFRFLSNSRCSRAPPQNSYSASAKISGLWNAASSTSTEEFPTLGAIA